MSDSQNQSLQSNKVSISSQLHICLFSTQPKLTQSLVELLEEGIYEIECFSTVDELIDFTAQNREHLDCILLVNNTPLNSVFSQLWRSQILLPTVIIETESIGQTTRDIKSEPDSSTDFADTAPIYHQAEISLYPTQIKEIRSYINLAITKFLQLVPDLENDCQSKSESKQKNKNAVESSLVSQQRRLTNKIKERLGYSGFFYKRNSNDFYRNLDEEEQTKLYKELSLSYEEILLNYFKEDSQINQSIDKFIDRAFFADISTSQILEIHMEIIDHFSYQLKLENRNDDILQDYRLTLIDITAHLCEMYRRSIPGDDISLELLFGVK